MKILLADDDPAIADLLEIYIRNEGHEVIKAHDGEEALDLYQLHPDVDVMILDIMMPKKDGIEVLKEVREESQVPILMLSAKASDMDKIKGLVSGADDYVTKPFNPLEVMARIQSLYRRSKQGSNLSEEGVIHIGPLKIDKASHHVETSDGTDISLTSLEFGILYLLASNPNRVFSAEEIFDRVWKEDSSASAKTVMVHVSHLRDKIERATDGEKVIETVWGVGYKISDD